MPERLENQDGDVVILTGIRIRCSWSMITCDVDPAKGESPVLYGPDQVLINMECVPAKLWTTRRS